MEVGAKMFCLGGKKGGGQKTEPEQTQFGPKIAPKKGFRQFWRVLGVGLAKSSLAEFGLPNGWFGHRWPVPFVGNTSLFLYQTVGTQ